MRRLTSFITFVIVMAGVTPAMGSTGDLISWFGFTMGTQVASYRATMGDPLTLKPFRFAARDEVMNLGISPRVDRDAQYLLSVDGPVFGIVIEGHGTVDGLGMAVQLPTMAPRLDVPADPNGVRLGDTDAQLAARVPDLQEADSLRISRDAKHNATVLYAIADGHVEQILWLLTDDRGAPPGAGSYVDPLAESEATAILETQATRTLGSTWEKLYEALRPCDREGGVWLQRASELLHVGKRSYVRDSVTCSGTGVKRDYWFDITASVGKM